MLILGPFPTEQSIAAAIADALSKTTIATTSAIQGNSLEIIAGDDYRNADGRALTYTFVAAPSLVGATIVMGFDAIVDGSKPFTVTGTVTDATTGYFELSAAQTGGLFIGSAAYEYTIVATLADGNIVTLARGPVNVCE